MVRKLDYCFIIRETLSDGDGFVDGNSQSYYESTKDSAILFTFANEKDYGYCFDNYWIDWNLLFLATNGYDGS